MKSSNSISKNWFGSLFALLAVLIPAFSCTSARAENISSLDTGAGYYSVNNGAVIVDPNWTVTLLSTDPPGQTPPAGIPNGMAYLVPNPLFQSNVGYPINTSWLPNDTTSTWITYSTPTYLGGDSTDEIFQYQLTFKAVSGGVVGINFLTDNSDVLYVNGNLIGSNPALYTFATWLSTPYDVTVTAGTTYTVDLDVNNSVLAFGNPTGTRIEFTGDVNVIDVPEPTSVALVCLGLAGLLTFRRRRR